MLHLDQLLPYDRTVEKHSSLEAELVDTSRDVDEPSREADGERISDVGLRPRATPRDPENSVPSWRPSAALTATEKYGRFEVLGRVGRGGMAEILLARERSIAGSSRHLVIKRILPEVADHDEMLHMFLDEARVVMGLSHPNLCQIFDVGEHQGTWYIAMEWVHGVTLHQLIRRAMSGHDNDVSIMACIVSKCAEALHHAHMARDAEGRALNLVHRDVSPHNVMVAFDGRVKLLDFGIAKSATSTHRTEAGVVKGKVCYMAPEQWLSGALDGRTDVFALGACLYEALTGEVVFRRESQMDVMKAIMQAAAPRLTEVAPHVPRALSAIVHKALEPHPEDRFQTALEMSQALELFLASLPEPVSAARLAVYTRDLFRAEVQAGPVLERQVRSPELAAAPLVHPPPPSDAFASNPRPSRNYSFRSRLDERWAYGGLDVDSTDSLDLTQPFLQAGEPSADDLTLSDHKLTRMPVLTLTSTPVLELEEHEPRDHLDLSGSREVRPLARTLSIPVVQSVRRIAVAVLPAAAALLLGLYTVSHMNGQEEVRLPNGGQVSGSAGRQERSSSDPSSAEVRAVAPLSQRPVGSGSSATIGEVQASTLLSIDTQPRSMVYLGQRKLGATPISRAEVPDGPLTLRLVDPQGRVHTRQLERSQDPVREVFFELIAR
jgi:serine/threonine-protein kinase